mmetsp:Transcript_70146/g.157534  ORF Transcript_70146/g.157534 Transcript_70146/m.157534 type:complete len:1129 (+) Transcript_70146:79-3465(+)
MDATMDCQQAHPEWCGEVTWEELANDLIWTPLVALCVVLVVMVPLNYIWTRHLPAGFLRFCKSYVGIPESDDVKYPMFQNVCFAVEMVLSLWFAVTWVRRSYAHKVSATDASVETALCSFFLVTYMFNAVKHSFAVTAALQPGALITIITVLPTYVRSAEHSAAWFSFGYLRIFNAIVAYEKIEKSGMLRNVNEVTRGYIITSLRTLVLIVILGGTVFTLEVIGDPEVFEDSFVQTTMGPISFIQITYWIITTISTVGYGDFAPTTVLSRLFIIVAIVVGVYFFSTEIGSIVELHSMQSMGLGKFKPYASSNHVVMIGGGVREFSSVLGSFLEEIFRPEHKDNVMGWPNVCFMTSAEETLDMKEAIKSLPKHARVRTKFFMGDPTKRKDMQRVRMAEALMVIVIPTLQAIDTDQEDQNNILRALAIKHNFPEVRLRLMLLRPANKARAVRVGIPPSCCFSVNELKTGIFAFSMCCRGWSTMLTHFLIAGYGSHDEDAAAKKVGWSRDYLHGMSNSVVGFSLDAKFSGKTFREFVKEAVQQGVVPIATRVDGRVMLNPIDHPLQAGDVVFALTSSQAAIVPFEDKTVDWHLAHQNNRTYSAQAYLADSGNQYVQSKSVVTKRSSTQSYAKPARKGGSKERNIMPWKIAGHGGRQSAQQPTANMASIPFEAPASTIEERSVALDMEEMEARASRIADAGGHYIIVVLAGNPWQQVQAFMRSLRGDHLPFHVPILVLAPPPMPTSHQMEEIFGAWKRCALMQTAGIATIQDLERGGLAKARTIALFGGNAGQASTGDKRMVDGAAVTTLASIEADNIDQNRSGLPILCEIFQPESTCFLDPYPLYEEVPAAVMSDIDQAETQSFVCHPRFASGALFSSSVLGALIARAYYTPGIVEVMEALVLNRKQTSYPWQVSVPEEYANRTYGELLQGLLEQSGLCLGLYRTMWEGASTSSKYVLTNPDLNTIVKADDLVIVLGPVEFGQDCFKKDQIPGVIGAPRADEPEDIGSAATSARSSELSASTAAARKVESSVCLSSLQQDLSDARKLLAESLAREADLSVRMKGSMANGQFWPPDRQALKPMPEQGRGLRQRRDASPATCGRICDASPATCGRICATPAPDPTRSIDDVVS